DRAPRRTGLHQDRRRGFRGAGACRPDAAGGGALVRVHHHPARGRARGARSLRRARLHRLRRGAGREPDARARRLAAGRRDAALARRAAGRGEFGRHLCGEVMSVAAKPLPPTYGRRAAIVIAMPSGAYVLPLRVFYPGVMPWDAWYIHSYIATPPAGDWQSPVMTALWALIDPLAPGAASMFVLIATVYWLGFTVLALALARRS